MENNKKGKDVQEVKRENNRIKISSGWELTRFCLKSKSFDLLLILMIGFVWCGLIYIKISVEGQDSTMFLLAVFVWPILICGFFLVIFLSMLFLTRNVKKNISVLVMFTLITLLIPIIMILSPLSRLPYSHWI